jgi:ribosome-associated protein
MNTNTDATLDLYLEAALGRKAEDILVLDVRGLTSIADYFIICSGRSNRQVSAIAEHIERFLKKNKVRPISVEGKREGHWVLMDYGDVLIHVFFEDTRRFYDLEGLWSDAKRLTHQRLEASRQIESQAFDGEEIFVD